ncbi:MAG: hypothetical protein Kow0092_06150 [Deferrisomatales bacterium]
MGRQIEQATARVELDRAEASRRIEEWYRRGYIMFSDVHTRSTHLRRVSGPPPEAERPLRGSLRRAG